MANAKAKVKTENSTENSTEERKSSVKSIADNERKSVSFAEDNHLPFTVYEEEPIKPVSENVQSLREVVGPVIVLFTNIAYVITVYYFASRKDKESETKTPLLCLVTSALGIDAVWLCVCMLKLRKKQNSFWEFVRRYICSIALIHNGFMITPIVSLQVYEVATTMNLQTFFESEGRKEWVNKFVISSSMMAINVTVGLPTEKRQKNVSLLRRVVEVGFTFFYVFNAAGSRIAILLFVSVVAEKAVFGLLGYHATSNFLYCIDDPDRDLNPKEERVRTHPVLLASALASHVAFVNVTFNNGTFMVLTIGTLMENLLLIMFTMYEVSFFEEVHPNFVTNFVSTYLILFLLCMMSIGLLKLLLITNKSQRQVNEE